MIERVAVYVELVNEGVSPVWRPTSAYRLTPSVLVLSNENYDAETEEWAVMPGSLITLAARQAHEGLIEVAPLYGDS
jgi:hypothetical protein